MQFKIDNKNRQLIVTFKSEEQKKFDKLEKELEGKYGMSVGESDGGVDGKPSVYRFFDQMDGNNMYFEEWLDDLKQAGVHLGISACGKVWEVTFDANDSCTVEGKTLRDAMDKAYKEWWKEGRPMYLDKKNPDFSHTLQGLIDDYSK